MPGDSPDHDPGRDRVEPSETDDLRDAPRDAMEPTAIADHPLPDIPMARPIGVEALESRGPSAESLESSLVRLTPWRAVFQIVVMFVVGVLGVITGGIVSAFVPLSDERWATLITMGVAGLFCVPAAFLLARSTGQRAAALGWRLNDIGTDLVLGVGGAIGMYLCLMMLALVLVLLRPDLLNSTPEAQKAIEASFPPASVASMVLIMGLVALWEEVVFRGFLLTRLYVIVRRWWLTVPIGAALFSVGHGYQGNLATAVIGVVGVLLGMLFIWRRSLLPAVAFHMTFNLISVLLLKSQSQTWN